MCVCGLFLGAFITHTPSGTNCRLCTVLILFLLAPSSSSLSICQFRKLHHCGKLRLAYLSATTKPIKLWGGQCTLPLIAGGKYVAATFLPAFLSSAPVCSSSFFPLCFFALLTGRKIVSRACKFSQLQIATTASHPDQLCQQFVC